MNVDNRPVQTPPYIAYVQQYNPWDEQPEPPPQRVRFELPLNRVWLTWVLLALNILMFVVSLALSALLGGIPGCGLGNMLGSLFTPCNASLQLLGWKDNFLIFTQDEYWRLIAATFLHGSLLHIGFNGVALYILGPANEQIYGTPRFLAIYAVAGLAGSVASYAFSASPSVGASGAIFGLAGALSVFYYISRDLLGEVGRARLQNIVVLVGVNLFLGFTPGSNIDNFGHIGGLIGGAAAGWLLVPRYSVQRVSFSPMLVRGYLAWGSAGVAALLLLLALLATVIQPPLLVFR